MDGSERAAVFLMSLGEKDAAEILKLMGPKEVQKIGRRMATLQNVKKEDVHKVLTEFCEAIESLVSPGGEDYMKTMLTNALGADKANNVMNKLLVDSNSKGLETLKWMEPKTVAAMIHQEHPQIIAIVLAHLDPDQAARVLSQLPARNRTDLLMRVATLDGIPAAALAELNEIFEKQFSGKSHGNATGVPSVAGVGGIQTAASILNLMESSMESNILAQVNKVDPDLSQSLQDHMLMFESLVDVDDRGIQILLRNISTDMLVIALKGADDALKEKIFANMSKRATKMLQQELDAKGPVRLSDVENAQKEVLTIARRMANTGQILLSSKGAQANV